MAFSSEEEKKKRLQRTAEAANAVAAAVKAPVSKPAAGEEKPSAPKSTPTGKASNTPYRVSQTARTAGASTNSRTAAKDAAYIAANPNDTVFANTVASYGRETADYANMTFDDAMAFAGRIVYDDERDAFLSSWQKSAKKQGNKSYMQNVPTMDEMRAYVNNDKSSRASYAPYREARFENMTKQVGDVVENAKAFKVFDGFTGMDGEPINMNSADMNTIIRAILAEPSKTRRDAYVGALETLTKTPGSRFYGVAFDKKQAGTFLNSANLTQDQYDRITDRYEGIFYASGHDADNAARYAEEAAAIEAGGYDAYNRRARMDALNDAYMSQTGRDTLPGMPKAQGEETTEQGVPETAQGAGDAEGKNEDYVMPKGGAVWNAQGEAYTIKDGKAIPFEAKAEPESIAPKAPSLKDAVNDERFRERYIERVRKEKGDEAADFVRGVISDLSAEKISYEDAAKLMADVVVQGGVQVASAGVFSGVSKKNKKTGEVYGPQVPTAAQANEGSMFQALREEDFYGDYDTAVEMTEAVPAGSVDLAGDPVRAVTQYVLKDKGTQLTRETQEVINALAAGSRAVRTVLGIDPYLDISKMFEQAQEDNDPFAWQNALQAQQDYMTGGIAVVIGSTLEQYLDLSNSEEVDEDLGDAMKGVILQIVLDAEEAYRNGEFEYDPEKENLYEAYVRLNPEATQLLRDVDRTIYEGKKEEKRQARLAAEAEERNKQEQLENDRKAVESGVYTKEQYDNVVSSAPVVTMQMAMADATYSKLYQDIVADRTLADGDDMSWYNEMTERYLRESGKPVVLQSNEAMLYKDWLLGVAQDILLSDARIAAALGYADLGEMYAKWGGMDEEKMHLRVEAEIGRMAAGVTDEALDALSYEGTGEDVSRLEAFGAGVLHGHYDTASNMLEAVWAFDTMSLEDRPSAVNAVRIKFADEYGLAASSDMYRRAMYQYCELIPEEHGNAILKYLDAGYDPFRLGVDPTQKSIVLSASKKTGARADVIEKWSRKNLDAKKGEWFESGSATGSTTTMMAVDVATQALTGGNVVLGGFLGYGLVGANETIKESLAAGMSRKDARVMGFARAASDTAANMLTNGKFFERISGFVGFPSAVATGVGAFGDVGMTKSVMGMAKRFGNSALWTGAKAVGETLVEEMFTDEITEDVFWQVTGGVTKGMLGGAAFIKAATDALMGVDVVSPTFDAIGNMRKNFIATLPMAILGGLGAGVGKARENRPMKNSVNAAIELASTGTPEAAEKFVSALSRDLEDPANVDALNKAMHDVAVGQEAAIIRVTDEEITPIVDAGAKAQEQADAHDAEIVSSDARMEAAQEAYYERKEHGDMPGANKAAINYTKANQGKIEHTRERDQKQGEADAAFEEATAKAIVKAEAEVSAREAEIKASTGTQSRLDEVNREIENIDRVADEMVASNPDGYDDQVYETMMDGYRQLLEERFDLEDQIARENAPKIDQKAVDAQMSQAQAAVEQVTAEQEAQAAEYQAKEEAKAKAQIEADEMAPVYKALRDTRVYVDDSQRANILSRTGLKTLSQVNRKFGLNLTNKKSENATSLDGSFFGEIADMATGRVEQDAAHPEDALMDIVERKKVLKNQYQASVGETVYEKYLPDGVYYAIKDPEMQQLTSDIAVKTGIDIVTAPLANNIRALYDRASKRIIINNGIGAGEIGRKVIMHELTHYIETSAGYQAYKDAVLKAAYMNDDADGSMRAADERRILNTYAGAKIELDEAGLESELVAEATEKIINDKDGRLVRHLLGHKQKGLVYNLMVKLGRFLARKKAAKEGRLEAYDAIEEAYERLKDALKAGVGEGGRADVTVDLDAAKRRQGDVGKIGENGQVQFAIIQDESGWPIVKADREFKLSDNPKEWGKQIRQYIRDEIRDKKVMKIKTIEGDEIILDNKSQDKAKDWLYGASDTTEKARKNASAHLDEVVEISEDANPNRANEPDDGRHAWAKDGWRYRTAVFEDYDGKRYLLTISVGQADGETTVYNIGNVEEIKKRTYPTVSDQLGRVPSGQAETENSPALRREDPSYDTSVSENLLGVNPHSTQNGPQYSLAPNQFGNETAQGLDTIDDAVKQILLGSSHEVVSMQDRLDAAWDAVKKRGVETVVGELLSMPHKSWGAQENANAALAAVLANRNGDVTTAAAILTRYDTEGSHQGQTLQIRQMIGKLTPEGAMTEMIRKANRANRSKGIPGNAFPMGEDAAKKNAEKHLPDGSVERVPEKVAEVYHDADELKKQLDKLPDDVSSDNPWRLSLTPWQMELIKRFNLMGEELPGVHYNIATVKQRMLTAIVSANQDLRGDGQTALCQQLVAMQRGYSVVTAADLHYVHSQMSQFRAIEGKDAVIPTTQEGREALGRAFQAIDNANTAGLMTKWTALRYANMLSAPATAARNVAGNVIIGALEDVSQAIATGVDVAVSRKTGNRTTSIATREERKAANAAFRNEVVRTAMDYVVSKVDTGHGRKYEIGGQGRVFQNQLFETYRNIVDFAMQIGDRPFFEQKYTEELAIIKRLGMKKTEMTDNGTMILRELTPEEMHAEATMRALYRVFQEDNAIVDTISSMRKDPKMDLVITTLMPFVKTPTNVAMRAIEYSPIGLITSAARWAIAGIDTGKLGSISQRDLVMSIGRGLTGTGLAVIGCLLTAAGIIRFGREDEENKGVGEAKKAQGIPYGMYIQIGDTMREIDWAMPAASLMAVGADFYKAFYEQDEGWAEAALGAIVDNMGGQIFDTPMLSAMNDIFRGYDTTENIVTRMIKTSGESLINQTFSPSFIRAIAKATDGYVRDTNANNWLMTTINKNVVQYWPGARQHFLPKATDITGDAVLMGGYYSWDKETQNAAMHFLDSFFTPTATIGEKNDNALYALLDISYRTGETAFLPTTIVGNSGKLTINKSLAQAAGTGDASYDMNLTAEERREFNMLYGDILFNGTRGARYELPAGFEKRHKISIDGGIRKMMESSEWLSWTDEERMDWVSDLKSAVKELVSYWAITGEL